MNGNNVNSAVCQEEEENGEFNLVQDPEYRRFGSTVDIEKCLKAFNLSRFGVGFNGLFWNISHK